VFLRLALWGYSLVVALLPIMCKALGWIPRKAEGNRRRKKKKAGILMMQAI
jgi:hypothetical protein